MGNAIHSNPDLFDQSIEKPFISVIVPVRNEESSVALVVQQLLSQDYPENRFEVIVVDGMSTDRTCEIVFEFSDTHNNLRILENPKQWSSAGRNLGIRSASGDIILIVDGHCELKTRQYLTELERVFQQGCAECVGRPQPLDVQGASSLQMAIAAARASSLGHHPDSFIYSSTEQVTPAMSVGVAYHRDVFDKVGLFDESFDACEDLELNYRIDVEGLRCILAPSIALHYRPRTSLWGLFLQLFRYGRGRMRMLRKHPDTFKLATFVPAILVVFILLGTASYWMPPVLFVGYIASVAVYFSTIIVFSGMLAFRRKSLPLLAWLPVVFVTIHASSGCGILCEALDIRRWAQSWARQEKIA